MNEYALCVALIKSMKFATMRYAPELYLIRYRTDRTIRNAIFHIALVYCKPILAKSTSLGAKAALLLTNFRQRLVPKFQ